MHSLRLERYSFFESLSSPMTYYCLIWYPSLPRWICIEPSKYLIDAHLHLLMYHKIIISEGELYIVDASEAISRRLREISPELFLRFFHYLLIDQNGGVCRYFAYWKTVKLVKYAIRMLQRCGIRVHATAQFVLSAQFFAQFATFQLIQLDHFFVVFGD